MTHKAHQISDGLCIDLPQMAKEKPRDQVQQGESWELGLRSETAIGSLRWSRGVDHWNTRHALRGAATDQGFMWLYFITGGKPKKKKRVNK